MKQEIILLPSHGWKTPEDEQRFINRMLNANWTLQKEFRDDQGHLNLIFVNDLPEFA